MSPKREHNTLDRNRKKIRDDVMKLILFLSALFILTSVPNTLMADDKNKVLNAYLEEVIAEAKRNAGEELEGDAGPDAVAEHELGVEADEQYLEFLNELKKQPASRFKVMALLMEVKFNASSIFGEMTYSSEADRKVLAAKFRKARQSAKELEKLLVTEYK